MELSTFGRKVRAVPGAPPVGVLVVHAWELAGLLELGGDACVDWIFLWQGDVRSLLALITQIEDRRNADHDVLKGGVQAIILVEDDVRFCSFFLPHLYEEVTRQTSRLLAEGLNLSHRLLRMRARPKVLLARTLRGGVVALRAVPRQHPRPDHGRELPARRAGSRRRRGCSSCSACVRSTPTCRSWSSRPRTPSRTA